MQPSRNIFFCLGRFGDVLNILPLIWREHQMGHRPIVCISREHESLLDAVSYCERIVWDGNYNDPSAALRWLKQQRPRDTIRICQFYRNPVDKQQLTDSYQTESWRIAGALDQFGCHPLVLDQRSPDRERALYRKITDGRAMILVAGNSISSPFPQELALLKTLKSEFPDHQVIDLSFVKAERVYDLLGLYDRASCLVSTDSVHLHLARASKVPVLAIRNDGWFGSVPPPATVESFRYADFKENNFLDVVLAIHSLEEAESEHRFVIHACQMHGETERHTRAQETWPNAYGDESIIDCCEKSFGLDSSLVGDPRNLPILTDVLYHAASKSTSDDDVVVLSNSDVAFPSDAFMAFRQHAALWGAFTMRRTELMGNGAIRGRGPTHMGREVFGFRVDWLKQNLPTIPKFYLGAPCFDLVLAAMIRRQRGLKTTVANLVMDFYPAEMSEGIALHESHDSSWAGPIENTAPANLHNRELARGWCRANMPSLTL